MNTFMNAMKKEANYKTTENCATAVSSTMSKLYDLFALGGAYRSRTESDVVLLFKEAYMENPVYAMKCLTYLRDIAEGQGERRFFRTCLHWLANYDPEAATRNIPTWIEGNYIRWDDLFVLFETPAEGYLINFVNKQLIDDMTAYNQSATTPVSLCAKWMPSENTSSANTRHIARKFINGLALTPREYRKMLSKLRSRINIVETLMSQNRWEEIDFSKLPSRAGLIYRNAFKNREEIAEKYRQFAQSKTTKVNAGTLYPYDVVAAARKLMCDNWTGWSRREVSIDNTERLMINKYWDNLTDYFNGAVLNGMVVCDTSGSMTCSNNGNIKPIDVAISLALYTAEHTKGPFANHYISFSRDARLVETTGVDFCDKVNRIYEADLCENTNLESVFNLVLDTAMQHNVRPEAMPRSLIVVSDMEVDEATTEYHSFHKETFMETMRKKWYQKCGGKYEFPRLYYWNVDARQATFLEDPRSDITFLSGCSPIIYEQILKGISGMDIMWDKLNSPRYQRIH